MKIWFVVMFLLSFGGFILGAYKGNYLSMIGFALSTSAFARLFVEVK